MSQIDIDPTAINTSPEEIIPDTDDDRVRPVLVRILTETKKEGHNDDSGQKTISFFVDDAGQFPCKDEIDRSARKSVVFAVKRYARRYVNLGFRYKGNLFCFLPPLPVSKNNNVYWIRSVASFVVEHAQSHLDNPQKIVESLKEFYQRKAALNQD